MHLECETTRDSLTSNPVSGLPGVVLAAFNKDGKFPIELGLAFTHTLLQEFSIAQPKDN